MAKKNGSSGILAFGFSRRGRIVDARAEHLAGADGGFEPDGGEWEARRGRQRRLQGSHRPGAGADEIEHGAGEGGARGRRRLAVEGADVAATPVNVTSFIAASGGFGDEDGLVQRRGVGGEAREDRGRVGEGEAACAMSG